MPHFSAADPPPQMRLASGPHVSPLLPAMLRAERPLQGLTVLAVEDSRFACEALRLLCQRAGARLRRAETIAAAQANLKVYRPDVVIVDLGLPDGRGEGLIRSLLLTPQRPKVVLGTSGAPENRAAALAAGADGFLEKPVENLASLCRALSPHLPDYALGPAALQVGDRIVADPLALHDDLVQAAATLDQNPSSAEQRYVAGFLRGVARHAHDPGLEAAALSAESQGTEALRHLVEQRLATARGAFAQGGQGRDISSCAFGASSDVPHEA
jgi:DNA-binding response OmpR family regulator